MNHLSKIITVAALFMFVDMIPNLNSEPQSKVDEIELLSKNSNKNMRAASAAFANAEKAKNNSVNQISSNINQLKTKLKLSEEKLNQLSKDSNEKTTFNDDPNRFVFALDSAN